MNAYDIQLGQQYRLRSKNNGDYEAYNGTIVTVVCEYHEWSSVFEFETEDGYLGVVYASELEELT